MEHEVIPSGQIHAPHNWRVATPSARLALSVTSADVGKLCWQQDDDSQWLLTTASPPTWKQVGGGTAGALLLSNAFSEFAGDPAAQEAAQTNLGLGAADPLAHYILAKS